MDGIFLSELNFLSRFCLSILDRGALPRAVSILLLVIMSLGCGKEKETEPSVLETHPDKVVFSWENEPVHFDEMARFFALYRPDYNVPADSANETEWIKDHAIQYALEQRMERLAREEGLHQRDEAEEAREEFVNEGLFRLYYMDKILKSIDISEQEVVDYYEEHPDDYHVKEKVWLKTIFFSGAKEGFEKARRRAVRVKRRLDHGAPFESLIFNNSDIEPELRMKTSGPYTIEDPIAPEIKEAAMELQVDEVSDIIESDKGYHLIKVVRRQNARDVPLSTVWEEVAEKVFDEKLREAQERFHDSAVNRLEVYYNLSAVNLPITGVNDVILRVEDHVLTYGDYLKLVKRKGLETADEVMAELQNWLMEKMCIALAGQEGYLDRPELESWVSRNMHGYLAASYLNHAATEAVDITEEQIREVYDLSPASFYYPRMAYVREVVIPLSVNPDMARYERIKEREKSRAAALGVLKEIKKGLSFEQAAKLYSSSANAQYGGSLGWVPYGTSVRFDRFVSTLEENEISNEPRLFSGAYRIFKMEKKQDSVQQSYEEAREDIRERLQNALLNQEMNRIREEIQEDISVTINPEDASDFGRYLQAYMKDVNVFTAFKKK